MRLTLLTIPGMTTSKNVLNFLLGQLQNWAPEIYEEVERVTDVEAFFRSIRLNGKSLGDIFGEENLDKFLDVARGALHMIQVLADLVSIVCLMASIVENFMHMQWKSVLKDCLELYGTVKSALREENVQLYRNLLEALKSLVSEEILRVVATIQNYITRNINSLAAYISSRPILVTAVASVGIFATLLTFLTLIWKFFFSESDKKKPTTRARPNDKNKK